MADDIPEADLKFIERYLPEIRKTPPVWGGGSPRSADATIGERVDLEASLLTLKALNRLNDNLEKVDETSKKLNRLTWVLIGLTLVLAGIEIVKLVTNS